MGRLTKIDRLRDVERGAKQQIEDMEGEIERLEAKVEQLRAALQEIATTEWAVGPQVFVQIAKRALEGGK